MDIHRFDLRIPKYIFNQIADLAKRENRSINSQIIYILKGEIANEATEKMQKMQENEELE